MTFSIRWSDGTTPRQVTCADAAEVEDLLDQLQASWVAGPATMVCVSREDGGSMSVGLGAPRSVVDHIPSDGDPPYSLAIAPGPTQAAAPPAFAFEGELSEYPPDAAISLELARECIREFCRDGQLSKRVLWRVG